MQPIIIVQPTAKPTTFEWLVMVESGSVSAPQTGSLKQLAEISKTGEVWLLIPSPPLRLTQIPFPKLKPSLQNKAFQSALTDQLACPLEEIYYYLSTPKNQIITTALIERKTFDELINAFDQENITLTHIYPSLCCQPIDHSWHMIIEQGIASVKIGAEQGFYCDLIHLQDMLAYYLTTAKPNLPQYIQINTQEKIKLADYIAIDKLPVKIIFDSKTAILPLLSTQALTKPPTIDLKKPITKIYRRSLPANFYYYLNSFLIGLIVSISLFNQSLEYYFATQANTILDKILSKKGIPPSTNILQLKQTIYNNKTTFETLYTALERITFQFPGVIINKIEYQNNKMIINLTGHNPEVLVKIIANLNKNFIVKEEEKGKHTWQVTLTVTDKPIYPNHR